MYLWLSFLFVLSRLFFLSDYPHFYDSPEYYRESLSASLTRSLAASHEVVHPLYLFLCQGIQHALILLTGQPHYWALSLISALAGGLSLIAFYFLVRSLFDKKVAVLSILPLMFFPHLWLLQTNILHESLDFSLFLLGLLFISLSFKKHRPFLIFLSVICWTLGLIDNFGLLIWFQAVLGTVFIQKNNRIKNLLVAGLATILSISLAFYSLVLIFSSFTEKPVNHLLSLLSYGNGFLSGWSLLNLLRLFRNDFLILWYGYTPVSLFLLAALYFLYRRKNYRAVVFFLGFFLPFLLTGKMWYGGLFSRYSGLVAFPLAFILGNLRQRKIYLFLVAVIFIFFLKTFLAYQGEPLPERQKALIYQSGVTEDDLLILSDYQRPQLPFANALFVNTDEESKKVIGESIEQALKAGKKVYVSQQALNFPYWQYDGQEIHIISRGSKEKAVLAKMLEGKKLTLKAEDKRDSLLSVYEVSNR